MRNTTRVGLAALAAAALALAACERSALPTVAGEDPAAATMRPGTGVAGTTPASADDCRHGGWRDLGFRNQGECIAAARHSDGHGHDDDVHGAGHGPIIFDRNVDGDHELFAIEPDGTGLTQLTDNDVDDFYPTWFPGGSSKIAFSRRAPDGCDIFILDLATGATSQVTDEPGLNLFPDVSPDGRRIAFASTRDGGEYEIYVVNVDGTGLTRLTNAPGADRDPDWSRDGRRIAFTSARDGNEEIYVMNADGTGAVRVVSSIHQDIRPVWSPNDSILAFASNWDGNPEIFSVRLDSGSSPVQLTFTTSVINTSPAWSPDGRSIIFDRDVADRPLADLWIINADGTGEHQVTTDPAPDRNADWGVR
ncbi:MAG TPA: hypothetical protein VF188_03870 [Longimicrobiales bacterium]